MDGEINNLNSNQGQVSFQVSTCCSAIRFDATLNKIQLNVLFLVQSIYKTLGWVYQVSSGVAVRWVMDIYLYVPNEMTK